MRALKGFKEFLEKGIVRKQKVDFQRAESLVLESDEKYAFLIKIKEKMGFQELSSNYVIETCYDILIELVRAKLLTQGYNSNSSHEAEVAYMMELGFNENEVGFMDDLRYFRNSIKYYGKILNLDYVKILKNLEHPKNENPSFFYAEKVLEFMDKTRRKLKNR